MSQYASLELMIEWDPETGRISSFHRPLDSSSQKIIQGWSTGGVEQAAHALLMEAMRREAILDVILTESADPSFRDTWATLSSEDQELRIQTLAGQLQQVLQKHIARSAEAVIREALSTAGLALTPSKTA